MSALLPIAAFTQWLAFGERGISSEAIVTHLTGVQVSRWGSSFEPLDPGDFRRCERLLRQVPIARLAFGAMRDVSPQWAGLVEMWDELVALAEDEVPGIFDQPAGGSAPRTYDRMQGLRRAMSRGTS